MLDTRCRAHVGGQKLPFGPKAIGLDLGSAAEVECETGQLRGIDPILCAVGMTRVIAGTTASTGVFPRGLFDGGRSRSSYTLPASGRERDRVGSAAGVFFMAAGYAIPLDMAGGGEMVADEMEDDSSTSFVMRGLNPFQREACP